MRRGAGDIDGDPEHATGVEQAYELDAQVGYLLRLAGQRHTVIFQENTVLDLTPTQFAALVRLADIGQCSQNELGRKTAMDVATIKGVVDRLHKKGLIKIDADLNDKRRSVLSIRDEYKEVIGALHKAGHQITQKTLQRLSGAEQKTFLNLLRKMV